MGCLEPRNGPHATPPLHMDLVHAPTPPQGRTHSPVRSLVGHSNLPSIPCPCHDLPSIGLHFAPPQAVPHPHFWPKLSRGNSSWQTPKAGMREIHKPDVLLWREGSGGWGEGKGEEHSGPCPTAAPLRAQGRGTWGCCTAPKGQGSPRISERYVKALPSCPGWWRKPQESGV